MKTLHVTRVSETIEAEEFVVPSLLENRQKLENELWKPKPDIVIDVSPFEGPEVGNIEMMTGT